MKYIPRKEAPIKPTMTCGVRNAEIACDGTSDCGYFGFGLDIAFSERHGIALVAYAGPGEVLALLGRI